MANKNKKTRKAAKRAIQLDAAQFAKQVVKMYRKGEHVADIAVAMGYQRGHGQNRVRTALMNADAYTPVRGTAASVATGKPKGAAITTAEQFARECYNVVESRFHKLQGRARTGFPELVMGMVVAGLGQKKAMKVAPVAVPTGLRLIRGGKAA